MNEEQSEFTGEFKIGDIVVHRESKMVAYIHEFCHKDAPYPIALVFFHTGKEYNVTKWEIYKT
jgi:hypothetical protein